MLAKLFFTRLESWVVPGENVTNGPNENHNPMDDINTDPHVWGGRIPQLEFGAKDFESFGDVCPSEGPAGGEWAC